MGALIGVTFGLSIQMALLGTLYPDEWPYLKICSFGVWPGLIGFVIGSVIPTVRAWRVRNEWEAEERIRYFRGIWWGFVQCIALAFVTVAFVHLDRTG